MKEGPEDKLRRRTRAIDDFDRAKGQLASEVRRVIGDGLIRLGRFIVSIGEVWKPG